MMVLTDIEAGSVPWLDIIGLYVFIAGFVIGLGAVSVIELHGFLGRKSPYWKEATTRTHKITKPLIWLGIILATIGGVIFYRENGLSGTAILHLVLLLILVLNGIFLSFVVSPYLLKQEREGKATELLPIKLQHRITASFFVSMLGWWGALFLLVWYILVIR
jgi:hypothetical protein